MTKCEFGIKLLVGIAVIGITAVLLSWIFHSIATRRFYADFFPSGKPSGFISKSVDQAPGILWTRMTANQKDLTNWLDRSDWDISERLLSVGDSRANPIMIALKCSELSMRDVEFVYSKVIDGTDIGYVLVLRNGNHDEEKKVLLVALRS